MRDRADGQLSGMAGEFLTLGKFFGASYRDPSKPSNMPAINYGPLAPYRDNWQIFDESSDKLNP